jgi:hypothetical protein
MLEYKSYRKYKPISRRLERSLSNCNSFIASNDEDLNLLTGKAVEGSSNRLFEVIRLEKLHKDEKAPIRIFGNASTFSNE